MNHYAFILGREYKLSLAELIRFFKAERIKNRLITWSEDMAVFECDKVDRELFYRLGGSIKFGEVKSYPIDQAEYEIEQLIKASINGEDKDRFGISVYAAFDQSVKKWQSAMKKFGLGLKRSFKDQDLSTRFVTSKEAQLSSVVVRKNQLDGDRGIEVLIGIDTDRVWIGVTEAVQDFEAFSKRDYDRPARDDVSGMLPLKLARMMINLAGMSVDKDVVLLDPFCGSGTVLQEAILLGAGKVLGSDVSSKAVADTQTNLEWLMGQYKIDSEFKVEQVDVAELSKWLPKQSVDMIVTEPYLGEPIRAKLSKKEIGERQDQLTVLYNQAFDQFASVVSPAGMVVIIFPFIDEERLSLPPGLLKTWEIEDPLKDIAESVRGGVDYRRPGQKVGREIIVLRKK